MLGIMPLLCQSIGLWCANRAIVRGEGKDRPAFVEWNQCVTCGRLSVHSQNEISGVRQRDLALNHPRR